MPPQARFAAGGVVTAVGEMRSVLSGSTFDVAVIGGGLTGAAVARDAAGRGLSVFLCEQGDLASGGSSATSKLAHGALDLMQSFQLGAMREAAAERAVLMRTAPHLVRPRRFLIPRHVRQWPALFTRLGLFAYDHAARDGLPPASVVDLRQEPGSVALHPHFETAFAYSDCVADDSRLAVLNAVDARTRGATIETRLRCTIAERDGGRWRLSLECVRTGERPVVFARILVNAGGAAAGEVLNHTVHARHHVRVRTTRAAHIVVRRAGRPDTAFALPAPDGQVVFAVPYEGDTLLLGPVRGGHRGDPNAAAVEPGEAAYLMDVASQYFQAPVHPDDIVWAFAAVTALPDDGMALRQGRAVLVDAPANLAPLVSVFGGSLTTYRPLAELAVDRMGKFRTLPPAWTGKEPLPGGAFPPEDFDALTRTLRVAYPFLADAHAERLARTYGTRASAILVGARQASDLGRRYGADLTEAEVTFLAQTEWAESAEDILWRRSKLGLSFSAAEAAALDRHLAGADATLALA